MHCPHCPASTLVISERSGIEIDLPISSTRPRP